MKMIGLCLGVFHIEIIVRQDHRVNQLQISSQMGKNKIFIKTTFKIVLNDIDLNIEIRDLIIEMINLRLVQVHVTQTNRILVIRIMIGLLVQDFLVIQEIVYLDCIDRIHILPMVHTLQEVVMAT